MANGIHTMLYFLQGVPIHWINKILGHPVPKNFLAPKCSRPSKMKSQFFSDANSNRNWNFDHHEDTIGLGCCIQEVLKEVYNSIISKSLKKSKQLDNQSESEYWQFCLIMTLIIQTLFRTSYSTASWLKQTSYFDITMLFGLN